MNLKKIIVRFVWAIHELPIQIETHIIAYQSRI